MRHLFVNIASCLSKKKKKVIVRGDNGFESLIFCLKFHDKKVTKEFWSVSDLMFP